MVQPGMIPALLAGELREEQRRCLEGYLQDTPADLQTALRNLGLHFRIRVRFSQPVTIRVNRNRTTTVACHVFPGFFYARPSNCLAYAGRRPIRSGFRWESSWDRLVTAWEPLPNEDLVGRIRALGRCIHPNAWPDLRKDCAEASWSHKTSMFGQGLARVDIRRKFPAPVLEKIRLAFENKWAFHWRQPTRGTGGQGRDLSVEVLSVVENGQEYVRAWFSSEKPGTGNGSYYLLLNPTTASFREDD